MGKKIELWEKYLLFYTDQYKSGIVPRSAFASDAEFQTFVHIAYEYDGTASARLATAVARLAISVPSNRLVRLALPFARKKTGGTCPPVHCFRFATPQLFELYPIEYPSMPRRQLCYPSRPRHHRGSAHWSGHWPPNCQC